MELDLFFVCFQNLFLHTTETRVSITLILWVWFMKILSILSFFCNASQLYIFKSLPLYFYELLLALLYKKDVGALVGFEALS